VVHPALAPEVTDGLREGDELVGTKLHSSTELVVIYGTSEDRSESFRRAEQIDVLPDKAGIDRSIEASLLKRNVLHALAVGDIDKIEGSCPDEILKAGLGPEVDAKLRQQRVPHRVARPPRWSWRSGCR
jgi:hypothetical protein